MPANTNVLVAGATGYLGGFVVSTLNSRGYDVNAISRSQSKGEKLVSICKNVIYADVCCPSTLKGIASDIDVVISSVGIRSMKSKPTFEEVDYAANINLLNQAVASGARHFIFVSVFKGDKLRDRVPGMRAREKVVDAIKASGLRYTVVRPNGFFNDMAGMFATAASGNFLIIGKGDTKINPIHGQDLANFLVNSIDDESKWNKEFDLGGPEIYTLKEIGDLAFEALGRKPSYLSLPTGLLSFFSHLSAPFNKNAAYLFQAMAILGSQRDMLAPEFGDHSLKDYFQMLATDYLSKRKI